MEPILSTHALHQLRRRTEQVYPESRHNVVVDFIHIWGVAPRLMFAGPPSSSALAQTQHGQHREHGMFFVHVPRPDTRSIADNSLLSWPRTPSGLESALLAATLQPLHLRPVFKKSPTRRVMRGLRIPQCLLHRESNALSMGPASQQTPLSLSAQSANLALVV